VREQLADMRLKLETVQLDRRFCEGLARAYLKSAERAESQERRHTHLAFAATSFRRTGAHAVLLDDFQSATKLFSEAAHIYARLRVPYTLMMLALAGRLEEAQEIFNGMLERFTSELEQTSRLPWRQSVYMLLFRAATYAPSPNRGFNVEGILEDMRRELQASGAKPVGILGLPVAAYLNLAVALAGSQDLSPQEAIVPFLSAYNGAMRQASLNTHHWGRMVLPFHPAEPDILSVLVLAHLALKERKRSVFDLLEGFPLAWSSRSILHGALQQRFPSG
jgi:hypothetical protein